MHKMTEAHDSILEMASALSENKTDRTRLSVVHELWDRQMTLEGRKSHVLEILIAS